MTTRTANRPLQGHIKVLAALGVTSLALIAASPANAIYRSYEPGDSEAPVVERTANTDDTKKGCTITLQNPDGTPGQSVVYPDGYSFSVKNGATGKTHTYTCVNGTWVETVSSSSPAGGYDYLADYAYVDGSGTVDLVNAHQEYTYSSDGASYVQP
jgi:hypothetical protein